MHNLYGLWLFGMQQASIRQGTTCLRCGHVECSETSKGSAAHNLFRLRLCEMLQGSSLLGCGHVECSKTAAGVQSFKAQHLISKPMAICTAEGPLICSLHLRAA